MPVSLMPTLLLSVMAIAAIMTTDLSSHRIESASPVASVTLSTPAEDFSRPFDAVIHLTLSPDWYLYWTNPGDAGMSLAAEWHLPEGFQAGDLRFPTPEKIVHEGIVAFGYYDDLIILCTLTPPAGYRGGNRDTIRVDLDWLVCSQSCIPGKASLAMALDVVPARRIAAKELADRFSRQAPGDLADAGIKAGTAHATRTDSGLIIQVPLTKSVDDFYPETIHDSVIDHKRITVGENGITIPATPYEASTIVKSISGLAIVKGKGYRLQTRVEYQ